MDQKAIIVCANGTYLQSFRKGISITYTNDREKAKRFNSKSEAKRIATSVLRTITFEIELYTPLK